MIFRILGVGLCLVVIMMNTVAAWASPLERVANSTLNMPAAPPVYGYQFTNAFPGATFINPMAIVSAPGDTNRLYIVERAGRIAVITNLAAPNRSIYLDISSKVVTTNDCALSGMAFHPGFATNGYFYVFYTGTDTTTAPDGTNRLHDILARYTAGSATTNSVPAATEQKLIRQRDRSGDHNAGDIHFGPDGYLYLALGDEGSPNAIGYDYWTNSQSIDKNFFSGIVRLDVDQKPGNLTPNPHPAVVAGTYKIPADNPFVGATSFNGLVVNPATVRTEFWAVGMRNPFRFSFDDLTGLLYVADVGQSAFEEVNLVSKGGNYGWSFREGAHPTPGSPFPRTIPPGFTNYIDPIFEYAWGTAATQGKSITGGLVYRGNRLSQLYGYYVFADYIINRVRVFKYDGTNVTDFQNIATLNSVVGFGTDPRNGDILAANIANGTIYRLAYDSTVTGTPLPPTLADTGAFTNLATLAPAPGVVAYDVNVPFWSDNAIKSRWFSLPDTNLTVAFSPADNWSFPTGTVWVKHFDLELTNGVPASAKRLETRLIVKNSGGVYGVTYRWGDSTTNATLVGEEGLDEPFIIRDSGGGVVRTQTWHYPGRMECLTCHTPAGGWALGFNTPQLNRDHAYGGAVINQIQALNDAGYFSNRVSGVGSMLALASATNTSASIEFRVRSYLTANCVPCHQPGGVALQQANWDARITTPLSAANIVDGPLAKNFGNPTNRVVTLRSLTNSVMYSRVANLDDNHMPPLATSLVNIEAVQLLAEWITVPPTINLVNARVLPGGNFQFTLLGGWGWSNIVQVTPQLSPPTWVGQATNAFDTNGLAIFTDTNAPTHPVRFYRGLAQ
jgi:glucose/arabinose dehydrogenase/mono/diheme cytochrome c family protein